MFIRACSRDPSTISKDRAFDKYIIHSFRTVLSWKLKNRCIWAASSGLKKHFPSTLMAENAKYIFIVVIKKHIYFAFDFTCPRYWWRIVTDNKYRWSSFFTCLHQPSTISKERALYMFRVLSRFKLYARKHICLICVKLTLYFASSLVRMPVEEKWWHTSLNLKRNSNMSSHLDVVSSLFHVPVEEKW